MGLILDTSFVIAVERSARRAPDPRVHRVLDQFRDESLFITFTVAGELACGRSAEVQRDWAALIRPYPVLPWTLDVAGHYGELYRRLVASGSLIGTNDLWIAATARAHGMGVVTSNLADFTRVPDLRVEGF